MAKYTEAQRKAVLKYRKEKTHSLVMNFPNNDWKTIESYCQYIQSPIATWIRKLIWGAISSDPTFTYNPEEEDLRED